METERHSLSTPKEQNQELWSQLMTETVISWKQNQGAGAKQNFVDTVDH